MLLSLVICIASLVLSTAFFSAEENLYGKKRRRGREGESKSGEREDKGRGGGGVEKRSNCMCREKKGWEKGLT